MKTKTILLCLALALVHGIGMPNSDKPSLQTTTLNHNDLKIILTSKIESEISDTTELHVESINCAKNIDTPNIFDITAFIKPEEEMDDLDFDTKIIFENLMKEKKESK